MNAIEQGLALVGAGAVSDGLEPLLRMLGIEGSVCAVTAGWQEREGEHERLLPGLGRPVTDLRLYARVEEAFDRDPALRQAHAERQAGVRALQGHYRARLEAATAVARRLLAEAAGGEALEVHRREALAAIRLLDRQHLRHLRAAHARFAAAWRGSEHAQLGPARRAVENALSRHHAVLVAGGHVAVLLNRLRLLDVLPLLRGRPVVAWGAGAMVCAEQVVLFDDHSADGPREPELLDEGLALAPRTVVLPGARTRLALGERERIAVLARRFAPSRCVGLDGQGRLLWRGARLAEARGVFRLSTSGHTTRVRPS